MVNDPRLGTFEEATGKRVWPEVTLSGKAYTHNKFSVPTTHGLDDAHFVVLDTFLPRDFDLEAARQELLGLIAGDAAAVESAQIPSGKKAQKVSTDGSETDRP